MPRTFNYSGRILPTTVQISPGSDFVAMSRLKHAAKKSGAALKGHMRTAHQGKFVFSCPACREIAAASAAARADAKTA